MFEGNVSIQTIILYNGILNHIIDITVTFHSGQRVKSSSVAPIPDTWDTDFHNAWGMNGNPGSYVYRTIKWH